MTIYNTAHRFQFHLDARETERMALAIYDALLDDERAIDPDMEAVLGLGEVEISFSVEATSVETATALSYDLVHQAIGIIGGVVSNEFGRSLEGREITATRRRELATA